MALMGLVVSGAAAHLHDRLDHAPAAAHAAEREHGHDHGSSTPTPPPDDCPTCHLLTSVRGVTLDLAPPMVWREPVVRTRVTAVLPRPSVRDLSTAPARGPPV